ncbi:MAG: prephenate dehydrogenase [bacterium]|nr:prephenate dehydrogenase [bacterium]
MKGFRRITVVGVGLIGGSLGLALKRKLPESRVSGVDTAEVIDAGLAAGALDAGFPRDRLQEAVSESDLVFLCAPIDAILRLLPQVAEAIPAGGLVTDAGSTKRLIVETADRAFPSDRHFIGGHPMSGSEGRGIRWSDPLLFENAAWVLTPSRPLPQDRIQPLGDLIERLGAKVLFLSPVLHDRVAAAVSHLPQLLAVTLMNWVSEHQEESPHFLKLAAGGFRDMTRIASSPYETWDPILSTNRAEILSALDAFAGRLSETRALLEQDALRKAFESAAEKRLSIPRDTRGFLRAHHDLRVRVEDRPGVIASIAAALAERGINIKDIEILKVREGEAGTLRLSLETPEARAEAAAALREIGFPSEPLDGR